MAVQSRRPPEYVATHDLPRADGQQLADSVDSGVQAATAPDAAASIGSTIASVMSGSAVHGAGAAPSQPFVRQLEAALSFAAAGPRLKPDAPAP